MNMTPKQIYKKRMSLYRRLMRFFNSPIFKRNALWQTLKLRNPEHKNPDGRLKADKKEYVRPEFNINTWQHFFNKDKPNKTRITKDIVIQESQSKLRKRNASKLGNCLECMDRFTCPAYLIGNGWNFGLDCLKKGK